MDKMHITHSQDAVIALHFNENGKKPYNREKSWIICEAGGPQMDERGRYWFIGSFWAHIYRKGDYHFETCFEKWGNGEQCVSVKAWKQLPDFNGTAFDITRV